MCALGFEQRDQNMFISRFESDLYKLVGSVGDSLMVVSHSQKWLEAILLLLFRAFTTLFAVGNFLF